MNSSAPDDPDLLAAVVRGDGDALDAWYRREHPVVHRLCTGFLADATEADDVAQDALLRLLDGLPRWDATRSWSSWRNTVVLNLCRDRLRRREARRSAEEAGARAAPPAVLPAPDDVAAGREVRAVLMAALTSLSPREREAFVLHDLQGRGRRRRGCGARHRREQRALAAHAGAAPTAPAARGARAGPLPAAARRSPS